MLKSQLCMITVLGALLIFSCGNDLSRGVAGRLLQDGLDSGEPVLYKIVRDANKMRRLEAGEELSVDACHRILRGYAEVRGSIHSLVEEGYLYLEEYEVVPLIGGRVRACRLSLTEKAGVYSSGEDDPWTLAEFVVGKVKVDDIVSITEPGTNFLGVTVCEARFTYSVDLNEVGELLLAAGNTMAHEMAGEGSARFSLNKEGWELSDVNR